MLAQQSKERRSANEEEVDGEKAEVVSAASVAAPRRNARELGEVQVEVRRTCSDRARARSV